MTAYVVTPPRSISSTPSRVPQKTKSSVTFRASGGKIYRCSQSSSEWSSATPRNRLIAACAWPLIMPGSTSVPRASIVFFTPRDFGSRSTRLPTSVMTSPSIATPPSSITRNSASIVTTVPPLMNRSKLSPRRLLLRRNKLQGVRRGRIKRFADHFQVEQLLVHGIPARRIHLAQLRAAGVFAGYEAAIPQGAPGEIHPFWIQRGIERCDHVVGGLGIRQIIPPTLHGCTHKFRDSLRMLGQKIARGKDDTIWAVARIAGQQHARLNACLLGEKRLGGGEGLLH